MRKSVVAISLSSLLLLCACDQWPPHQQDVVDHFYANEAKIDGLRSKLIASDYSMVSLVIDDVVEAYLFDESTGGNRLVDVATLPDEGQWLELFSNTHVTVVTYSHLDSTSVVAGIFYYSGYLDDEISWGAEFIHNPNLSESVAVCSKSKPATKSGTCAIELSGGWWLRYVWRPKYEFE